MLKCDETIKASTIYFVISIFLMHLIIDRIRLTSKRILAAVDGRLKLLLLEGRERSSGNEEGKIGKDGIIGRDNLDSI